VNDSQLVPNAIVPPSGPQHPHHQITSLPVSYSLATGLSAGYDANLLGSGNQISAGFVISQGMQYGTISGMHQQAPPGTMSLSSPYQAYTSYPAGGGAAAVFSTLQHPRRVRVLPPASNATHTPPPLGSPANSLTSSASTSLAANVHRTSNDQLSRSPMTDV